MDERSAWLDERVAVDDREASEVMTADFRIELLQGRESVMPLRDSVEELCQDLCEANPFFEPWFLFPALKHLDRDRRLHFLCLYETGGQQRLCGFLPLAEARLHPLLPLKTYETWAHSQCFRCTPLVRKGMAEPFWRAVLTWLKERAWHCRLLHLQRLPAEGELWNALERALGDHPSFRILLYGYRTAFLRVGPDYAETIHRAMSGRTKRKLEYYLRSLAKEGQLAFSDIDDDGPLDSVIEEFLQLEAGGWKGKAGTALASTPSEAAFFRDVVRAAADRGRLGFLTMRLDGRMIAAQSILLSRPGTFLFKVAYDEAFHRHSPGVLVMMEEVRRMHDPADPIRAGLIWSDSCSGPDSGPSYRCYPDRMLVVRYRITTAGTLHSLVMAVWPMVRRFFVTAAGRSGHTSGGSAKDALHDDPLNLQRD